MATFCHGVRDDDSMCARENLTIVINETGQRTVTLSENSANSDDKVPQKCTQSVSATVGSCYTANETVNGKVPQAPSLANVMPSSATFTGYNLSTTYSKSDTGYVGLVNQAMTCYLNSLLQTLFMTPEFCNAIYRWQYTGSDVDGAMCIPYQLQRLFLKLQTSQRRSVETTDITRSFGWDSNEAWQQHDIQELCRAMFDALEKTWENTTQANLINELYEGKMKDCVQCLQCGAESSRTVSYLDIQLPVRRFGATTEAYGSVTEALKAFCSPEILTGSNQFYCEQCQGKCDAHKSLKFVTFPYLLTIHLLRFDFDYNTLRRIKLNHRITFPDVLDLKEFVTECKSTQNCCNINGVAAPGECCDQVLPSSEQDCSASGEHNLWEYELFSIMVHSGNATGGHYYAYIKSFETGQWYSFNDQLVTKITVEDICSTYGGQTETGTSNYYASTYASSTNAYMLMYRRIDKHSNTSRISVDNFPLHLKAELQKLQDHENVERHLLEVERTTCKIKLFLYHPVLLKMVESTLAVDMNATLSMATEIAWKQFELDKTSLVPLDCVRLVKYDALRDYIDRSFDITEQSEPIHKVLGGVRFIYSFDLLLETKQPQQKFDCYKPGGVSVKVFVVDLLNESVASNPFSLRVYLQQTVAGLKEQIVNYLPGSCPSSVDCVLDIHSDLRRLADDERTLKAVGFGKNNKVFVESTGCEKDVEDFTKTRFCHLLDRFNNTISIHIHLPQSTATTDEPSSCLLSAEELVDGVNKCELNGLTELSTGNESVQLQAASDVDTLGTSQWTQPVTDSGDNSWLQHTVDRHTSNDLLAGTDRHARYFTASLCTTDSNRSLKVSVDKRITVKSLKRCLQSYVGVTADNFDLYRVLSNGDELEMKRTYETMSLYDNDCSFRVKLGRPLKSGEYRLNVYQFKSTDQQPIKFLLEAVVSQGMSVSQLKQSIIDELHGKSQFTDLTVDRCRLRRKMYKKSQHNLLK
jgi:ubiquitin carboxyl-terminal hydrolase 47